MSDLSIERLKLERDTQSLLVAAPGQDLDDGLLISAEAFHSLPEHRRIIPGVERVYGHDRGLRLKENMIIRKLSHS